MITTPMVLLGLSARYGWYARALAAWACGALLLGALTACDDDPPNPCDGGRCGCTSGSDCRLTCERADCDVACQSNERCGLACQDRCVTTASSVKQFSTSCGADCSIGCSSVESCAGSCGDRCDVSCINTKACDQTVGVGATVRCESVERCAIRCSGACRVTCQNVQQGGCQVRCGDGSSATVDAAGLAVCP